MPDQTTPSLAEHFTRVAEHYAPQVHIYTDGDEPLAVDHIGYCAERFHEFAGQNTGDLQVPAYFEYIDAEGAERGGNLADADAETLAAGLAHLAAQAAALQRELMHVTDQGIAILRLLDQAPHNGKGDA